MKPGAYLRHVPNKIILILANFCLEFLIKNRRNFTECAEAKMSEKWFSEFRMILACAAFGFAVAVSLQDAHALYIEQIDAAPLKIADHGSTTPSNYFFISLNNIASSKPLQNLDPEMGSRPANGVPTLDGQVRNNPSNLANTFRLQFDDEKQLSNTNIPDIKTEISPYLNIDNRPSALEQGPSIFAEQSAYMDKYTIDFVKTIARNNETDVHTVHRNVSAIAHSLNDGAAYQFDSGHSGASNIIISDPQQVVEYSQVSQMLLQLMKLLSDPRFYMVFVPFCILLYGLNALVEKVTKKRRRKRSKTRRRRRTIR